VSDKSQVISTEDGSSTLVSSIFNERYHSKHGARTESQVVFIDAGLKHFSEQSGPIKILEMGFGTGLNALMSWDYADKNQQYIEYKGYEKYPIELATAKVLNYGDLYKSQESFLKLHSTNSGNQILPSKYFKFQVNHSDIFTLNEENEYHVIFYDAFAPLAQEELWTTEIFNNLYKSLKKGGVLVTYCAKGQVKRNLKSVGFKVIGLPGPPGKREMTKAIKY
jgi:tRNA U34 5-methylaminomethyl-2-thiouridine-forming methyltransferase MnmC